jgi:hypothetical protein
MRPCALCPLSLLLACTSPDTPPATGLVSGNVGVTVIGAGGPAAGTLVVFADPGGAVVASGVTGADGVARHDLPAGGSVSMLPFGQLYTVLDVGPGDEIRVGIDPAADSVVGSVHVVPPGPYAGAGQYLLELGCNSGADLDATTDQSFDLLPGCMGPDGTVAALAHADDDNGHALAFSGARGLPVAQGIAEAALPAWKPAQSFKLQITNPQAWIASYDIELSYVAGGTSLSHWSGSADAALAAMPMTVPIPAGKFVDQLAFAFGGHGIEPASGLSPTSGVFFVGGAPAATVPLDAGQIPPHITRVDVGGAPQRPEVSWQTDRPYAAASATAIVLGWSAATAVHDWTVIGPPTSPLVVPPLAPALASYGPRADTTDLTVETIVLEEISDSTGYRDWMAKHHGQTVDITTLAPRDATVARIGLAMATR